MLQNTNSLDLQVVLVDPGERENKIYLIIAGVTMYIKRDCRHNTTRSQDQNTKQSTSKICDADKMLIELYTKHMVVQSVRLVGGERREMKSMYYFTII